MTASDSNAMFSESATVTAREVRFEHSSSFPTILEQLQVSLLVSTYQAGKLLVVGSHNGQLTFSFHTFDQVMGIAVDSKQIAVGARRQIYFLNSAHECAPSLPGDVRNDQCWISRSSFITGSIHGHDLAWGQDGLWVVNTLFSCLCTLNNQYNFVPRWKPPFISQLIDQDRCHLNGLAMESGTPRYVTVLGESNEPAGWRPNKAFGGAVLDVPSGRTLSRGLCMPHSPRVFNGDLWFCNSGMGHLSRIDRKSGSVTPHAALPGYTRGLALHAGVAFVGLSKIRETNIFGGLPIGEFGDQLRCGVGIVELSTGRTLATLQFHSGVEEIFAVEAITGGLNPKLVGPQLSEPNESEVWIVPNTIVENDLSKPDDVLLPTPGDLAVEMLMLNQHDLAQHGLQAHERGDLKEALQCYRRALQMGSPTATLLSQLGNLYQDLDDQASAMACYAQAAELDPKHSATQQNLGVLYATQNQPLQALKHFELAQQSNPHPMNFVLGANVLPVVYDSIDQLHYWRGRLEDRLTELGNSGVQIDTTHSVIPTSFFFAYQGYNDRSLMNSLAKVYGGVECCEPAKLDRYKPRGPRIRVGFVSSYFCNHTIGRLNLGVIERLSKEDFEVSVISLRRHQDAYSELYRRAGEHFVELSRQPDVARRAIAEMNLDVLIFTDVGMDCLTQTLCYSRMAPIQAVTWGHPDTTGSPAIDYYISTELAEPKDAQEHYSEQLQLLPTMGVYYPKPQVVDVPNGKRHFGLDSNRRVYLCPQTLFKFHPEFDAVLTGILQADPDGDLVVIESRNATWNNALRTRWEHVFPGGANRTKFLPAQPRDEFLKLLRIADVVLDPFPFCGGNSTYEALAMEAPVVTFPGEFLRGRLTFGIYRRMALDMMVASSPNEYIDLCVQIATDPKTGQKARRAIRETNSVLFENQADVRSYENLLKRWCGRI